MKRVEKQQSKGAFTLVELMAAVTISLIVVLLLYTVFDKVQKVFVKGQSEALVMEEGRSAMDLILRGLQYAAPAGFEGRENLKWVTESGIESIKVDGHEVLKCSHHQFQFFAKENGWRKIEYKLVSSEPDEMVKGGNAEKLKNSNTPVGALWVYRSKPVARGLLNEEEDLHENYKEDDKTIRASTISEPLSYAKLVDGVIHFRIRALDEEYSDSRFEFHDSSNNPYIGNEMPGWIEVELAVLDPKLLREIRGMEQSFSSNDEPKDRYEERLGYITENMDRVYFFKQVIRVN